MNALTRKNLFLLGFLLLFSAFAARSSLQLGHLAERYNSLLAGPVEDAARARLMQVKLKKQVQEWKNILLRGHTPNDLELYTQRFSAETRATQRLAHDLLDTVDDLSTRLLVGEFIDSHDSLNVAYERAYQAYLDDDFDWKQADLVVRGLDRPVTDQCDAIVVGLDHAIESILFSQRMGVARERTWTWLIACFLLVVWATVGLSVIKEVWFTFAESRADR